MAGQVSEVSVLREFCHLGLNSVGVVVLHLGSPLQLGVEENLKKAVVVISCQSGAQLSVILS